MNYKNIKHSIFTLGLLASSWSYAQGFVLDNIRLEGEKRISLGTVKSLVNFKKGDEITSASLESNLKKLYESGFFRDVQLLKNGNDIVIKVDERPAISEITFKGNVKLEDDMLNQAFSGAGLVAGRTFDPRILDTMRKELESVYYSLGRYGVDIESTVTDLSDERVKVAIQIREGRQAKIKHINIVGNQAFEDKDILKGLQSASTDSKGLFSSKDNYEKNKLAGDLEAIKSYYLDRGYLDSNIESTQVSISNDKKDMFISVSLDEGEQYKINSLKVAGDLILDEETYKAEFLSAINEGDVFSRKQVLSVIKKIQAKLGTVGYPNAKVVPTTDIDAAKQLVDIVFNVNPLQKTYINRISFIGNDATSDKVYRRELRQMESALYNSQLIERSRERIQRLEYVESVSFEKVPVAGKADAVDIVFSIKERLAGSFNAGVGLSDSGTSFTFGITQSNVFGTGNALSLNLASSDTTKNYSLSYRNPYYKKDGMSRTLRFNFRRYDGSDEDITADYLLDSLSLGASYGMPLSEYSRFNYGYSIGSTEVLATNLDANGDSPVQQIQNFIDENGNENRFLRLNFSYSLDKRNRRIFATKGSLNRFSYDLTTAASDVSYYEINYTGEKYFAAESGSLFLGASPLEIRNDAIDPDPIGGNLSTTGTVAWLMRIGESNSSQFSFFYDFGSVFQDSSSFETSEFRSSLGIGYNWLSPVGPLVFSYAKPVNKEPGDEAERFQFTIGSSF